MSSSSEVIALQRKKSLAFYIYRDANGFLPLAQVGSFMLQANWLKFGMLMCFDMEKVHTEPENGKNP